MPLAATDPMDRHSHSSRQRGAEPIPGYRLIEPLGKGAFGEAWKCEAPGGLLKAIKFVGQGDGGANPANQELQSLERIKDIRHPFLLSLERVEQVGGALLLVLELADRHLADVLLEAQRAGKAGIDRETLLGYLAEAAEALDLLNREHGLQHLDVKPHNLFLIGNHVKVGDFGQVGRTNSSGGAFSPIYSAPERFENTASRHSDQYSLAIVYQELLTGTLPFNGKNGRQLLMQHLRAEPDLSALPGGDRTIVARALAKAPADRFPSCAELVRALRAVEERSRRSEVRSQKSEVAEEQQRPQSTPQTADFRALTSEISLRLLDRVRCTPLTEVRQARSDDGTDKLVTFLYGADANERVIDRFAELTHPALVPGRMVLAARGGLALIADVGGRSLRDRFREHTAAGGPGIPRGELLGYLRAAAEALDFLSERHAVAHLGLNPRNLLLSEDRLRIAEFGLAWLLWLPARQDVAGLNARYSAPELFRHQAGPACDQYSLALIYRDLLTGAEPGLDRLPPADRDAIARALEPDPARRWPSCSALIDALDAAGAMGLPGPAPAVLRCRFDSSLGVGRIAARLEEFRSRWRGRTVRAGDRDFLFEIQASSGFWRRLSGRHCFAEVAVALSSPPERGGALTQVEVELRPGSSPGRDPGWLARLAPELIESLKAFLLASAQRRIEERVPWPHALRVCCVGADGKPGEPIECRGKDISSRGIGFYLEGQLPSSLLRLSLPRTAHTREGKVAARVVRIHGRAENQFEIGALLLPDNISG